MTPGGPVAVEDLAIGDLVTVAGGGVRPVVWLGRKRIACKDRPDPRGVWPIRVAPNAFAEGAPSSELWLSPGHNILFEGVLMPIAILVNGRSVRQVRTDEVEYWHVELDQHDIVLAEGLAAESFLDTGNRASLDAKSEFADAFPLRPPRDCRETCVPIVHEGVHVVAAKELLLRRLHAAGEVLDQEADPHLIVDGLRIDPIKTCDHTLVFSLPPGAGAPVLRSRRFVPAHVLPGSSDDRTLGLCVRAVRLDGTVLDLADDEVLGPGWNRFEGIPDGGHRWTSGEACLPTAERLVVELGGGGHYWRTTGAVPADQARTQTSMAA